MEPPAPLLAVALGVTGLLCLVLAVVVWQGRRASPAAPALTLTLAGSAWWDLTYAAFWAGAPDLLGRWSWLDVTYVGVLVIPTALLVFAARFSGRDRWVRPPVLAALAVEPVLVGVLLATDASHGLFYGGERGADLIRTGGPAFWLNVVYSYLLVLLATVLLVLRFLESRGLFRRQAAWVLAGIAVPWVVNLAMLVTPANLLGADPTPFAFSATAAAWTYALVRFRMLAVSPVTRHAVLDRMLDGVLVTDPDGRLTDANSAAVAMLRLPDPLPLGALVADVVGSPALVSLLADVGVHGGDVDLSADPELVVDVRVSDLTDRRGRPTGRVIVLRDITERRRLEAELERQARTDPLTGLGNRRAFTERGGRELARVRRRPTALSVVVLDVDDLKPLNDRLGHAAGDAALCRVADTLLRSCRVVDVVARIGGDEFALVLPGASLTEAWEVVRRVQVDLMAEGGEGHPVRVSAGIASIEPDAEVPRLEELVRAADRALYEAKRADRGGIRASAGVGG